MTDQEPITHAELGWERHRKTRADVDLLSNAPSYYTGYDDGFNHAREKTEANEAKLRRQLHSARLRYRQTRIERDEARDGSEFWRRETEETKQAAKLIGDAMQLIVKHLHEEIARADAAEARIAALEAERARTGALREALVDATWVLKLIEPYVRDVKLLQLGALIQKCQAVLATDPARVVVQ